MIALVTGSTGFIGANLSRFLLKRGTEVHVILRRNSNKWRIKDIESQLNIHNADITDAKKIDYIVKNIKPSVVYHTAAYGGFPFETDTKKIIKTNIFGTLNLIQSCIKHNIECFVNTGTSSEYGIKNKPMSEDDLLDPLTIYGSTKAAISIICKSQSTELPMITLRLFSPFGFYENKSRLIPQLSLSYLRNESPMLASKKPVRDFIFIEDVMNAHKRASNPDLGGQIFNIGSGKQHTVEEVSKIIKKLTESDMNPVWNSAVSRKNEPKKWVADISKSQKILEWAPKYSLEKGLKRNVEWFKKNLELYN
ncbi:MAG: SDR family NAD(P)-dependent oxidoreductase [Candidatus Aenigmarchaeota archaeon]|nr:SDR family NAD(P)-dependent oxidoreductase [Candidatus Aenigmarchaeota archaeon]MDI6722613.1 SDR family NAD(P)-dependent oxidoreductase [Candidatus Aenigmarchaeota archaeon]